MDHRLDNVTVVGAGLAGLRACETVRGLGFAGEVVLVGAERHLPYDRPPLSKQLLAGAWETDRCVLRAQHELSALGLSLRLGVAAVRLDLERRVVELADGDELAFGGLVLATGASPRLIEGVTGRPGVHTLRTFEDAEALRAVIERPGAHLAIAGAGFIGLEVAATARAAGAEVTVIEPLDAPMARVVGSEIGAVFADLHRAHGVDLRLGATLAAVDAPLDGASGVRLTLGDGGAVEADALLVGVGARPEVAWLEHSGLEVGPDGVRCDAALVAGPDVVAAGDLARWPHPVTGELVRVEHRTNAAEQGEHAARSLLAAEGEREPFAPVSYVWSDQFDVKLQVLGSPHADDATELVDGVLAEHRFVLAFERAGRLSGVIGCNRPRLLMGYRALLERGASFDEALALTAD